MSEVIQKQNEFLPESTNLVELLDKAIERHADRPLYAVRQDGSWRWTTYRECGELIDALRGGLASLGVGHGDRVAIIANNRPEWAIAAYAVYTLGACYVPMYENQLSREWQYILADSGAKVCLVANQGVARQIEQLRPTLLHLETVVALEGAESDRHSYASLLAVGRQRSVAAVKPRDDALAALVYTSGTTGKPKGVKLSHYNLASNACGAVGVTDVGVGDRSIAFLPWAHVFGGCIELNGAIANGCCGAICDDPSKLPQYLPEVQPTVLFGVPRVWNRIYSDVRKRMSGMPWFIRRIFEGGLLARARRRRGVRLSVSEALVLRLAEKLVFPRIVAALGGQLRCAYSGAAKLSAEVADFIENLGIQLYDGYGMTEASGCITVNPRGSARQGSVGKPIRGVRVEIDKSVAGASSEDGEIIVYGSGVMLGYWNQAELTRTALTPRGGLRTGDLGRLDADGYLYLTGRVKELYKLANGKYVAPSPVEETLTRSPFIAECVVYGADKPHNVALLFPDMPALEAWARAEGLAVGDRQALLAQPKVRALLRAEVDRYSSELKAFERIAELVMSDDEPTIENGLLTPSLKIKRVQVMARYAPVLEALYGPAGGEVRAESSVG